MKLGEMLNQWYSAYVEGSDLAPSTVAMYRRAINAIPVTLAAMAAEEVTPMHLTEWLKTVKADHPRAAQLDRVMLIRAIKTCSKLGLCRQMILDEDTLPKPRHHAAQTKVLTPQEMRAYIHEACSRSKEEPAAVLLLCCCMGLRRGEALGLRPEDYEPITGIMHIRQQRQRTKGAYTARKLKSRSSTRDLLIPEELRPILSDQAARSATSVSPWLVDITPEKLNTAHRALLSSIGADGVTLHGLRHTFATIAAMSGVPMQELKAALGHSKIAITADLYADHLRTVCNATTTGLRTLITA